MDTNIEYGDVLVFSGNKKFYLVKYDQYDDRGVYYDALLINLYTSEVVYFLESLNELSYWTKDLGDIVSIEKIKNI